MTFSIINKLPIPKRLPSGPTVFLKTLFHCPDLGYLFDHQDPEISGNSLVKYGDTSKGTRTYEGLWNMNRMTNLKTHKQLKERIKIQKRTMALGYFLWPF